MEFDINNRVRKLQEETNQKSSSDQEYYDEDDYDFEFEGYFENLIVEHSNFDFGPLLIKYLNSAKKPEKIQKEKEKKPKVKKLNSMEIKYKYLDSSNSIVVEWKKPKEFHHVNGYEVFRLSSKKKTLVYKGKETSCIIHQLEPDKKYKFFIKGYNLDCYDEFIVENVNIIQRIKFDSFGEEKGKMKLEEKDFKSFKFIIEKISFNTVDLVLEEVKKENKINKLKMNVIEVKKKIVFSFFHKKSERVCKIKFLKPNTDYCVYVQYLNEERILLPAGFQYFGTLKNPKNK
jgi:hypothetical protein